MVLDGINDGDLAIVKHGVKAKNGQTVVAITEPCKPLESLPDGMQSAATLHRDIGTVDRGGQFALLSPFFCPVPAF